MGSFSAVCVISFTTVIIALIVYHLIKIAPYKKIIDGLCSIYNLNEDVGTKFYRVKAFHAMLVYKHITSAQRRDISYMVLSRIIKTSWMKKFLREDLKLAKNAPLSAIAGAIKLRLPLMKSCDEEIINFINTSTPSIIFIKDVIKKIEGLRLREINSFMSVPDLNDLRSTIDGLNKLELTIVFFHLFGFNVPFSIFEDNPGREFTATEETIKNTIMDYVTSNQTPCVATVEISPNVNKRALYRERALRSGSMLIEISATDNVCERYIEQLKSFKNDIEHENVNTVLSLFSYLGMAYNLANFKPYVINPFGEKRKSFLIDDKFNGEEVEDALSKIKVDDLCFGLNAINCPDKMTPNKITIVFKYSRIGRVYKKKVS